MEPTDEIDPSTLSPSIVLMQLVLIIVGSGMQLFRSRLIELPESKMKFNGVDEQSNLIVT